MGIVGLVLAGLAVGALVIAIIKIVSFTVKKLKEIIKKRLDKREKQKVLFGKSQKILDEQAKDIIESAPSVSMSELESVCDESPYFVVNYDEETDEVSDFAFIQAEEVEQKVEEVVEDDGIMLFD